MFCCESAEYFPRNFKMFYFFFRSSWSLRLSMVGFCFSSRSYMAVYVVDYFCFVLVSFEVGWRF